MSEEFVDYEPFNFPTQDLEREVEKVEQERAEEVYQTNQE